MFLWYNDRCIWLYFLWYSGRIRIDSNWLLLQQVDIATKYLHFQDSFILSKLEIASSILSYPLSSYVLIPKMHLLCFLKCLLCESFMQVWMVDVWEQIKRQDDIHVVKIIFLIQLFLFISQVFISSHYPTQINLWNYRAPVVHLVAFGDENYYYD